MPPGAPPWGEPAPQRGWAAAGVGWGLVHYRASACGPARWSADAGIPRPAARGQHRPAAPPGASPGVPRVWSVAAKAGLPVGGARVARLPEAWCGGGGGGACAAGR